MCVCVLSVRASHLAVCSLTRGNNKVSARVRVCVYVCVCAREREREKERE